MHAVNALNEWTGKREAEVTVGRGHEERKMTACALTTRGTSNPAEHDKFVLR